ncbi:hypothetical protein [Dyadobacter sp. CY323]|uniref:hypothetical protein n=1 Tax=Dyadobacter sp. CY323 TaxID=2907302 RepID=UPI001F438404|nr:hypothetical protein [Dyadobacter sp. CY323]MCE6991040.1 hypothetical protein [Dyadobacter sp. CY323]
MDSNLEQKRRELFELHKAKIGTDAPLMRRPVVVETKTEVQKKEPVTKKSKIKIAVIAVTSVVVIAELVFLAKEAGWFGR